MFGCGKYALLRLKRNGHWALLCRYEHERVQYSMLEEIADRLVAVGMTQPVNQYVREIQLNMDPDETTADKLAGSPGYYNRAVHSIRNILKRGFHLRDKAVVTALTVSHLYEWLGELQDMRVRR